MKKKKAPYKPAILRHFNYDLSKKWYVEFYAFHPVKQDLVRKRIYADLNQYKTTKEREFHGKLLAQRINQYLKGGSTIKVDPVVRLNTPKTTPDPLLQAPRMKVLEALEYGFETRSVGMRKFGAQSYRTAVNQISSFIQNAGLEARTIDEIPKRVYQDFLDGMIKSGRSAVTVNKTREFLRSICNSLIEREVIKTNPFSGVRKYPEQKSTANVPFDSDQIPILKKAMKPEPGLWFFVQCIYYLLARPAELRRLKVMHVDLFQKTINFPASISKNKKDGVVAIPDVFLQQVKDWILGASKADFFFGNNWVPSSDEMYRNKASNCWKKLVKDQGLLYPGQTMYSWKHTGAVSLYKVTKDIKEVQLQCRHHSSDQTDLYLKSLGFSQSTGVRSKFPKI